MSPREPWTLVSRTPSGNMVHVDESEGRERVHCPLRAAAGETPDAPAVVGTSGALTYGELDHRVSAVAGRLVECGLVMGSRVAIYLPKDERYITLLLALLRSGSVACPVSTRIPSYSIAPLLGRAGCSVLVSEVDDLPSAVDGLQTLRPEVVLGGAMYAPSPHPGSLALDQPATIIFTSGSTGTPKAALHTFGNHYHSALGSKANIPLAPGDRWLHSLPLYHVGGLSIIFRCMHARATIVLPDPGSSLGRAIAESGATHVSLVTTQLRRLLIEDADAPLDTLDAILLGGGPIPHSLIDEALARNLPVHASYGLTEMSSQVATTSPDASPGELRTAGRVLPHREVSVSGEGEILVRGETLFAGYVDNGEIRRPVDSAGWFHTGDLGEIDVNGYLHIQGRKDNLIISGGENIQPEEIEAVLRDLEGVEQAVVVPVPDEEFGERPVAFVRWAIEAGPYNLRQCLGRLLPRFKIPDAFHEWPRDAPEGIKVDRGFFRDRAILLR